MDSEPLIEDNVEGMDQVEHMLKYPERDLGDTTVHMVETYMLDIKTMSIQKVNIPFNKAVERIFLEFLYNAEDNTAASDEAGIPRGAIYVTITPTYISIKNEGKPISTDIKYQKPPHQNKPVLHPDGSIMRRVEFMFGRLLTSGNYNNNSRKVGGRFGIGAKAGVIFSVYCEVDVANDIEKKRYKQIWKNNMSIREFTGEHNIPEDYEGPSYTKITYLLDFARFYDDDTQFEFAGKRKYSASMIHAFAKHCADASVTAQVPVYFNNKLIDCRDEEGRPGILKYANLYFPNMKLTGYQGKQHVLLQCGENMCLVLDTPGNGTTISFVNGVINEEGGVHVDRWRKLIFKFITTYVKEQTKFGKKAKMEINKHIMENISMIIICRLLCPKYKSQTKDKVVSPVPNVSLTTPDEEEYNINKIYKWNGVKAVIDIVKAKLNLLLKKNDGSKNEYLSDVEIIDAKYVAHPQYAIECSLYVTEGKSARNFPLKGECGDYDGAMAIQGKFQNVGICDAETYDKNPEIIAIKKALGLKEGMDYSEPENEDDPDPINTLRYGKHVIILSDQDIDGMHIRGLLLNFFMKRFPSLLKRKNPYVLIMETPLYKVKYHGRTLPFYSKKEYEDWVNGVSVPLYEGEDRTKIVAQRFKGLGSSTDDDIIETRKYKRVVAPRWDAKAEQFMSIAFDEGNEDERKKWLLSWDSTNGVGIHCNKYPNDSISHFVTGPLCEFTWNNTGRTIPRLDDGLKKGQRKILTVILDMAKEKTVSQVMGVVKDAMHYENGEESIYRTIVNMANYCVGTNNYPLLKAGGQFDSREGHVAAHSRYISVSQSHILKYLFRKEDTCILKYQYYGKDKIEPECYYPIFPIFAMNGDEGVGTGWSTDIPPYTIRSIYATILWWLKCRAGTQTMDRYNSTEQCPFVEPPELIPWYKHYQGSIERIGKHWYSIGACQEIKSTKKIKDVLITEIPVTQTIETYSKKLEKMKTTPIDKNWTDTKNKCPMWIKDFKLEPSKMEYNYKGKNYIEILPRFKISQPTCLHSFEGGALKIFGLMEKISETNIVLLNSDGTPCSYAEEGDPHIHPVTKAISAFCSQRYDAYIRRRNTLMKLWKDKMDYLELKKRYIKDVINNIILFRDDNNKPRPESEMEQELLDKGYPIKFLETDHRTCTIQGIARINDEIKKFQVKYDKYKKTSPANLWLEELKTFLNSLE